MKEVPGFVYQAQIGGDDVMMSPMDGDESEKLGGSEVRERGLGING